METGGALTQFFAFFSSFLSFNQKNGQKKIIE